MPELKIYTDGGCSGNPGPGAWAAVISLDSSEVTLTGRSKQTTNNQMELTAVIKALEYVKEHAPPRARPLVFTDSQYVKKGITEWILNWRQNGWKNKNGEPIKNQGLWERLWELDEELKPSWHWVRGHASDPINKLCDALVQAELKRLKR